MKNPLRRIRKDGWQALGGIIVVGGVVASIMIWIVMPWYTRFNQGVTVPELTALSYNEAVSTLEQAGLRIGVAARRNQTNVPPNAIIDQNPKPFSIVKPNRRVYVTVNAQSRPKAVVPRVVDMSLRNATIQLENSGLSVGNLRYESNRFRNTVLDQSLIAGDTVNKGARVDLVISDGLGDTRVRVPELAGLRLPEAQQRLQAVGLRIAEIRFQPVSDDVTPNTVLEVIPDDVLLIEGESLTLIVAQQQGSLEQAEREQASVEGGSRDSLP
ncbi:MAG: PASTA domain-containing protein [Balneolaceae bacterium]|nr:PASTA domain-containing protein [Balneolaceae bacterium]MDR9446790.1 PASTA domain-containing protein [Balneolaceae bacterium]